MKVERFLLPVLLAAGLSTAAEAQQQGLFFFGGVGGNFATDTDISGPGLSSGADLEDDITSMLGVGYRTSIGLRPELEIAVRNNDVERARNFGTTGNGSYTMYSGMFNVVYEFLPRGRWNPYVGIGAGVARADVTVNGTGLAINDRDTVLALQGLAGVGYRYSNELEFFADYRYFTTEDLDLNASQGPTTQTESDYQSHALMVGLRFALGTPKKQAPAARAAPKPVVKKQPVEKAKPKPKVAAAPPQPPKINRDYLVFFDWDQAFITPTAAEILREAAQNAARGKVTRIEATGHADTSGSKTYNMRLSERRAIAVREALIARGVPASEIKIFWKGESDPLVPTKDGVREPQNRRVQIILK